MHIRLIVLILLFCNSLVSAQWHFEARYPIGNSSSLAFDSDKRIVYLYVNVDSQYGGYDRGELWRWSGEEWLLEDDQVPAGRFSILKYDPDKQRLLLFRRGFRFVEVWARETKVWRKLTHGGPRGRYSPSIAYNPKSRSFIMVGGFRFFVDREDSSIGDIYHDTWIFHDDRWRHVSEDIDNLYLDVYEWLRIYYDYKDEKIKGVTVERDYNKESGGKYILRILELSHDNWIQTISKQSYYATILDTSSDGIDNFIMMQRFDVDHDGRFSYVTNLKNLINEKNEAELKFETSRMKNHGDFIIAWGSFLIFENSAMYFNHYLGETEVYSGGKYRKSGYWDEKYYAKHYKSSASEGGYYLSNRAIISQNTNTNTNKLISLINGVIIYKNEKLTIKDVKDGLIKRIESIIYDNSKNRIIILSTRYTHQKNNIREKIITLKKEGAHTIYAGKDTQKSELIYDNNDNVLYKIKTEYKYSDIAVNVTFYKYEKRDFKKIINFEPKFGRGGYNTVNISYVGGGKILFTTSKYSNYSRSGISARITYEVDVDSKSVTYVAKPQKIKFYGPIFEGLDGRPTVIAQRYNHTEYDQSPYPWRLWSWSGKSWKPGPGLIDPDIVDGIVFSGWTLAQWRDRIRNRLVYTWPFFHSFWYGTYAGSSSGKRTMETNPGIDNSLIFDSEYNSFLIENKESIGSFENGALPFTADLDGDGIASIGLFDPARGIIHIKGQNPISFGQLGDQPVIGDYDGDGKDDIVLYRPKNGKWISTNGEIAKLGTAYDTPVKGDYDGDGKVEPAVYNAESGTWTFLDGSKVHLGDTDSWPVPADYDGDGKTDITVWNKRTGQWRTKDGVFATFGYLQDLPAPGDYDGDGKAEPALYRPVTGEWIINGEVSHKTAKWCVPVW